MSLFNVGLTGLNAAQTDLKVTGNNIANVETTGFKQSRAEFGDIFSQTFATVSKTAVGQGARVLSVSQLFTQGTIELTGNGLDLAISGQGFFTLKDTDGSQVFTRAGEYQVDREGYIVNTSGQRLQGFEPIDPDDTETVFDVGAMKDIQLLTGNAAPSATTDIRALVNLRSDAVYSGVAFDFPNPEPTMYNFSTSITVYDSLGTPRTMTMYFAKPPENVERVYPVTEQVARANPNVETFEELTPGVFTQEVVDWTNAGASPEPFQVVSGNLEDADGNVIGALTDPAVDPVTTNPVYDNCEQPLTYGDIFTQTTEAKKAFDPNTGDEVNLWDSVNSNGWPLYAVDQTATPPALKPLGDPLEIPDGAGGTFVAVDENGNPLTIGDVYKEQLPSPLDWTVHVGMVNESGDIEAATVCGGPANLLFDNNGNLVQLNGLPVPPKTLDIAYPGDNPSQDPTDQTDKFPNGAFPVEASIDFSGSTQYGVDYAVNELNQDGWTTGRLAGVDVDASGRVFTRFTNGQSQILSQVALANFTNPQGLTQLGDNNWAESYAAGSPVIGAPATGDLGSIEAGSLENSNVDLAQQLVNLITGQRNYQANSKTIETANTLTQTILNIR